MNTYCIVIGDPKIDPIAVAGPFDTEEEAAAELEHYPTAHVDILIDPQNLREARGAAPSNH